MKRPTMFEIQAAIVKNICAPSAKEDDDFTVSRLIRASGKMEGDSQLGMLFFVGIADDHGYSYSDISHLACIERAEYTFKLKKYKRNCRSNNKRFLAKKKLIENYLRLKYGVQVF